MKLKTLFGKISLPLFAVLSLCACSRFIEGEVFLDRNANNIKDFGEGSIPGLRYTVTFNNATQQTGVTDATGHFIASMGSGDVGANYCVQVKSEDVASLVTLRTEASKSLKAVDASPEATSEVCPLIVGKPDCNNVNCCDNAQCAHASVCEDRDEDKCSKDSDGKPDCGDKDCCAESECKDASECQAEPDPNACPKDDAGEPNCNDSRCSKEAACNTYTVQSMQACDQSKAAKMTLRLDVPVAMDYVTRIGKVEAVHVDPVAVGDRFGIEITYPSSCRFEPYTLPAAFVPVGLGPAFNPMIHELLLDRAVALNPSQIITRDAPPFGHDALFTYVLRLDAVSEAGVKDGKVTIQPSLTCPDGKRVSASANVISFGGAAAPTTSSFTVKAQMSPLCPTLGESADLKTYIQGDDESAYSDATYTLLIGHSDAIAINSMPSQCQLKTGSIECAMDTLHMGLSSEFNFNFSMADSVSDPITVTFQPKLDVKGSQVTGDPIACSYP